MDLMAYRFQVIVTDLIDLGNIPVADELSAFVVVTGREGENLIGQTN